jgi:hypothetical protein
MEKTYKTLNHDKPLVIEEIRRLYRGYWVYIVNAELDETNAILSGIPVVIGARPYDGAEENKDIYTKYRADEYAPRIGLRN